MQPWRASGVVTLLSDFGLADPYVGVMKGVLLREAPGLRAMVDLTHEVAAQDVRAAAFLLSRSWSWFPAGSVHLAVVDPGVGTGRGMLAAVCGGHGFVAPDNGLLWPVLAAAGEARVVRIEDERLGLGPASATFHGRDRFAPAAGRLAAGGGLEELGRPVAAAGCQRLELPRPAPLAGGSAPGALRGEVLLSDRFGNLITNVEAGLLGPRPAGRWVARVAGRELRLVATYGDGALDELVALVDSYDLVEIARRNGDAARTLGLAAGAPVELVPAPPR